VLVRLTALALAQDCSEGNHTINPVCVVIMSGLLCYVMCNVCVMFRPIGVKF